MVSKNFITVDLNSKLNCKIQRKFVWCNLNDLFIGVVKTWEPHDRIPACTLRDLFTRFLDLTTPPTTNLLQYFASIATDKEDQERLTTLATVSIKYFYLE